MMIKRIALFWLLLIALAIPLPASAVVNTLASQITVGGNSSQTVFQFPFIADSVSDIALIYTNSSGGQTTIPPSQYLVALNPITTGNLWGIGGSVTYPLSGSPIASGTTLTIQRAIPLYQTTALSNQGNFYPQVVEEGLDIGVMQTQQVAAKNGTIRGTWLSGTLYNYGDIITDGTDGSGTGNLYACAIPNTSGTWSTDLSNGDWVLALNVQGIVNFNPSISNNYLFANISGISAQPYGVGASAFIDSAFGSTQGSILYRSGSAWVTLAPGTNGQFLKTLGAGANPVWATPAGSGTVTEVDTGTGLTGGPITGAGTVALMTVADASVMANISGGTAAPGATTLSAFLDYILGSTQGSIIYRGALTWAELTPGTSGQVLTTGGASANPSWGNLFPSQNVVTGSRSIGSVYHNTTGKPMFVTIYVGGNGTVSGLSDSSPSPSTEVSRGAANSSFSFMVLNGNYYETTTGAGSPSIAIWTEWH